MIMKGLLQSMGVDYRELWPEDSLTRLQGKCDRLAAKLRRQYQRLVRYRFVTGALQDRVRHGEQRAGVLGSRIERWMFLGLGEAAAALSEELAEARFICDQDRDLLQRRERRYQRRLANVMHSKIQLAHWRQELALQRSGMVG